MKYIRLQAVTVALSYIQLHNTGGSGYIELPEVTVSYLQLHTVTSGYRRLQ